MTPDPLKALVTSRKVIVTVCALVACVVLVAVGKLAVHDFVTTLTVLVSVLTGAIALEDAGRGRTVAAGGDVVIKEEKSP